MPQLSAVTLTKKVLVTDRDAMSSQLLADTLGRDPRFEVVVSLPAELMRRLSAGRPHMLIISANLPGKAGSGLEMAHSVHRAFPDLTILVLMDSPDRDAVIGAFRAGARGVFSRLQSLTEFLECVHWVSAGRLWAGQSESGYLLEALKMIPAPTRTLSTNAAPLTRRELEVIERAAQGKTNKTIATQLGLSEHTVKNYLFRAFEKIGVSSRVELLFHLTTAGHGLELCSNDAAFSQAESDDVAPVQKSRR